MAGYSGAPLAQKLGIGARSQVCVVGAPKGYAQLKRYRESSAARQRLTHIRYQILGVFESDR